MLQRGSKILGYSNPGIALIVSLGVSGDKQPGVKKPIEIDASMLYATAFEFTAIGASQLPVVATVSIGR